ncbi:hypothetical protein [Hydrotalea lipotrueae]
MIQKTLKLSARKEDI